jgi:two-component system response regulator AlgR
MKILIADDESLARERLLALLAELNPTHEIIGQAANGLDALRLSLSLKPDVVLLDIHMPSLNGLDCARELSRLPEAPAVIFTTAYDDYALEAFEVAASDYLLKPIRRERLEAALARASRFIASRWEQAPPPPPATAQAREHICAYLSGEVRLIAVEEILYFRSEQKYTMVRTPEGEIPVEDALKALEQEFSGRFVRIHRNALASLEHAARLERHPAGGGLLWMRNVAEPLDVSRRNFPELRAALLKLGKAS